MQEQVDAERVKLGQEGTRSCRLRPSRSTDQAMTISNCALGGIVAQRIERGRLSRPLAPLMP